ncbi:MAG TPA: efflux RND transporter periplasmic adaptor subunit [Burkholderiales bacterium]|nr:efflux RND transporter periplasmic adaptor subunit [Burkholderiales bacterium]
MGAPPMMSRLLRPRILVPALITLAVAAGLGARAVLGTRVEGAQVARAEIVQTIVSTGRVISPSRMQIGSVVLGNLVAVNVREGNTVKAGQVLARLRDDEARAAVDQARGALREAGERMMQLERVGGPVAEQALNQAEASFVLAEEEYSRVRRLHDSGYYGKAKLDEAERNLATARAQRESARAQAESNRPTGADHALVISRRAQAQAALEAAEARLANTRIAAPADGTVLKRLVEPGDVVQQGKVLFEMDVAGETQLLLNVDEKNLRYLAPGQRAAASADAFPNDRFEAEIFYISPLVDAQRGTVEVKLRVPRRPAYLRTDMTVSAEIEAGRRKDAVVVPSDALRDAAGRAPWVLVVNDHHAVRRPVKLGLRGAGQTEIVEGLAPGDIVIPATETNVGEGQRVRVDVKR